MGGWSRRADKGTIIGSVRYYDASDPAGGWAVGWSYMVRWDDFDHDTERHGTCLRPINEDILDALADIED